MDYGCKKDVEKVACDWLRKTKEQEKKEECYIKTEEKGLQSVQILKSAANAK